MPTYIFSWRTDNKKKNL